MSINFDPSSKSHALPIKHVKRQEVSKGARKYRVKWDSSEKDKARFDFAIKPMSKEGSWDKKRWVKVEIGGQEVLGNIKSIVKRYGIEEQTVRTTNSKDLGVLLKIMAEYSDLEGASRDLKDEELKFIDHLSDKLMEKFKTQFGANAFKNSFFEASLQTFLIKKYILNQDSTEGLLEQFISADELQAEIREAFIGSIPLENEVKETEKLMDHVSEETHLRLKVVKEAAEQAGSMFGEGIDQILPLTNLFIYEFLMKNHTGDTVTPPPLARLAQNLGYIKR